MRWEIRTATLYFPLTWNTDVSPYTSVESTLSWQWMTIFELMSKLRNSIPSSLESFSAWRRNESAAINESVLSGSGSSIVFVTIRSYFFSYFSTINTFSRSGFVIFLWFAMTFIFLLKVQTNQLQRAFMWLIGDFDEFSNERSATSKGKGSWNVYHIPCGELILLIFFASKLLKSNKERS